MSALNYHYKIMTKVFKIPDTDLVYKADNVKEAYYLFIEQCLGIKLTTYQIEDVLKNIVRGNPILDLIEMEEVLP